MRLQMWMLVIASTLLSQSPQAANVAVTVTPSEKHQTLMGIGGGIAYRSQQSELMSHQQSATIMDTLFTGARASFIRISLADTVRGWTDKYPYKCWNQDPNAAPKCTAYVARSTYRPLKQIVDGATKRLGYRPKIFASVWSPPAQFKTRGYIDGRVRDAAGNVVKTAKGQDSIVPKKLNTLKKVNGKYVYAGVAQWMRKALESYRDTMGFFPDHFSIQNEPWTNVAYGSCVYSPTENDTIAGYAQLLQAVYDTLKASHPGLEKSLVGPEVEGMCNTKSWTTNWQQYAAVYIRAFKNPNHVSSYAFHFYNGGDYFKPRDWNQWTDTLNQKFPGKPLIMSENMWLTKGHDTSVAYRKIKLVGLGHTLTEALTRGNISAYINWEMVWGHGQMVDIGSYPVQRYNVNPEYHSTRHFSRFTAPGWVRIGSKSSNDSMPVAAFASPNGDTISVMAVNIAPKSFGLTLPSLPGFALRTFVQSTTSAYSKNMALPTASTVTLPDSSIATFQYVKAPNQAPTISMKTTSSANLWAPGAISFDYTAADVDGSVALIELLQNGVGVKYLPQAAGLKSTTGTFVVTGLPVGTYVFTPKATDNLGKVTYGANFNVSVKWNYALTTTATPTWYGGLNIGYNLPAGVSATAHVVNSDGKVIKTIILNAGTTSSRFTALSGKPAGNYTVQILINNVVVASKTISKV